MSYNTHKMFFGLLPLLSVSVLLCSGCGGGGGGGSSSFVSTPVAISGSNAPQVAAASTQVGGSMAGTSSAGGGATPASAQPAPSVSSLWMTLERQFHQLNGAAVPVRPAPGRVTAQGMSPSITPCGTSSSSGSYTVTVSDTSATISYSNCIDSLSGDTLNGSLYLTNIVFDSTTFSAHMSTSNFTDVDTRHTYVLSGVAEVSDVTQKPLDTFTMSGGPLTITVDSVPSTLNNFTMIFTEDTTVPRYTVSIEGVLDSQVLGGHVTLDTTAPFVSASIDGDNPSAGSMLITGANNSSVKVTALGGDDVRLEVDADGIGGVDPNGTTLKKWSELEALTL